MTFYPTERRGLFIDHRRLLEGFRNRPLLVRAYYDAVADERKYSPIEPRRQADAEA